MSQSTTIPESRGTCPNCGGTMWENLTHSCSTAPIGRLASPSAAQQQAEPSGPKFVSIIAEMYQLAIDIGDSYPDEAVKLSALADDLLRWGESAFGDKRKMSTNGDPAESPQPAPPTSQAGHSRQEARPAPEAPSYDIGGSDAFHDWPDRERATRHADAILALPGAEVGDAPVAPRCENHGGGRVHKDDGVHCLFCGEMLEPASKAYFGQPAPVADYEKAIAYAVAMCNEMANRYHQDIEGRSGEELIRYEEGIECARRLGEWIQSGRTLEPQEGDLPFVRQRDQAAKATKDTE